MATAIILGGGKTVLQEYEQAKKLCKPDIIICVNDIGCEIKECDIWATLHPEKLGAWISKRNDNGYKLPEKIVSFKRVEYVNTILDYRWTGSSGSGSSGLFAVKTALSLGYNKIVLCGVPINKESHYFSSKAWSECDSFSGTWREQQGILKKYVRSMSGYTRNLLGYPDQAFFE